ncbi:MAG: hypothetical protein WED11_00530, partial [Natronospirillum sp.]
MASVLLAVGCASVPITDYLSGGTVCHEHLTTAVAQNDQAFFRPTDQPYFAISRLHANFDPQHLSSAAFSDWRSRVVTHSWQELAAAQQRDQGFAEAASRSCLVELAAFTPRESWQTYADAAADYDLYRDWQRWLGLYPLTAPIAAWRIRLAQAQWLQEHGGPFDDPSIIAVHHYTPEPAADAFPGPEDITAWFTAAYADTPLGLPQLRPEQLARLITHHAPALELLMASEADRLGSVAASFDANERLRTHFDPAPATYVDTQYTQFDGVYYLQLAYSFWFPERRKSSVVDLTGGPWNGITWRVTLDAQGQPMWFDAVHNCGCYHHVWLPDHTEQRHDITGEEPLFLPYDWTGQPRLTLMPGDHFIRHVVSADSAETRALTPPRQQGITPYATEHYTILPYSSLLALPAGDEFYVSLFDHHGLVQESQRLERFIMWPFGVRSAGAMRRNGTHAITFVGKRYFDDPRLFEAL